MAAGTAIINGILAYIEVTIKYLTLQNEYFREEIVVNNKVVKEMYTSQARENYVRYFCILFMLILSNLIKIL